MNRFATLFAVAFVFVLLILITSWLFKPAPERVTLDSNLWICTDTTPVGLHAECTNYLRKPKATLRAD